MLPLALALIAVNGFAPMQIFLPWGLVYMATGFIFKVPVSVQPLKAMAVIAISKGSSPVFLSSTAFFYGLLFILLSSTGVLGWLEKWFSVPLVRGIQAGIGLILAQKAINLILENGLFLSLPPDSTLLNAGLLITILTLLAVFQYKKFHFFSFLFILLSMAVFMIIPGDRTSITQEVPQTLVAIPQFQILADAIILLMIPQLPLTLGNAVFAASDSCHQFWGPQARRVSPKNLGLSIGFFDTLIGLFGGFPMCHGSGGMAAHAQFGGKTGGTTIIMGGIFIAIAFIPFASQVIFALPVPVLSAMLLLTSWRMIHVSSLFQISPDLITIILVATISLLTRNLSIALVIGIVSERIIKTYISKQTHDTGDPL